MIINFLLKEAAGIEEESVTITFIKKNDKARSQTINAKDLTDLTAIEQQTIRAVLAISEKYRAKESGSTEITYSL
jgi:hypothetical protein